jgi:4'-phosphopantetheinyl transferase
MTSTETNLAALRAGKAHVWLSFVQNIPSEDKRVWQMLSDEERMRAGKLRVTADRAGFVLAHALVRAVLSQYHPVDPGAWEFGRSPQGKPFISAPVAAPPLQFNLSHTRGLAACVVALELAVGVDVEYIEPHADLPAVAREFFASAGVQELEKLSDEEQGVRFYEHWTRREACGKASGLGLSLLSQVDENPKAWQCWQQRVSPDHILAAAVGGGQGSATVFTLQTVRWRAQGKAAALEVCNDRR